MTNISYTKTLDLSFERAVQKVMDEIGSNEFSVLHIHNIREKLKAKDIDFYPYQIIEFCRAPSAKQILDIDPEIGLMLPCKIIVYEKDGQVTVSAIRPTLILDLFPKAKMCDLPEKVDAEIKTIIDNL